MGPQGYPTTTAQSNDGPSSRDFRDAVIEDFADGLVRRDERIAALEDECAALRALAESRGDDAATLRLLLRQAWDYIYELAGDDLDGYWEKLDDQVAAGWHLPPQSVVAKLRRRVRLLERELRALGHDERNVA